MSKKSRENKAKREAMLNVDGVVENVAVENSDAPAALVAPKKARAKVEVIRVPDGCKSMTAAWRALEASKKKAVLAKEKEAKFKLKMAEMEQKSKDAELKAIEKAEAMELKELEKADKAQALILDLETKIAKQLEMVKKNRDKLRDAKALIKRAEKAKAKLEAAKVAEVVVEEDEAPVAVSSEASANVEIAAQM